MSKPLKKIITAIFVTAIIPSCSMLYIPNTHNSPLLRNKGDVDINTLVGISGFEAQSAVAVTDKIGLMVNGQLHQKTHNEGIKAKEMRTLVEGALGYTERFSDMGIFEVFVGGGVGSVPAKFKGQTWNGEQTTKLTRYFVQPAIGFCNDLLDFSIVSRLSLVSIASENKWYYEPGVVSKLGYKRVRFVANLGFSIPLGKYENSLWQNFPVTFSIGMHINLGNRLLPE